MNKIIEEQLKKTENVDLSNFDKETNTYYIKKRQDIKVEEDQCYILKLKNSAFNNTIVTDNWNNGNKPKAEFYKADISKKMSGMIRIIGVAYDNFTNQDLNSFWSGWLSLNDIEIIRKL